jgi:hypothetical protein
LKLKIHEFSLSQRRARTRYHESVRLNAQDAIVAISALFIVGMIWLRTRMQYARRGAGPLQLEPAGRIYFACVVALLIAGWVAAPWLGRALWPGPAVTPTLMRVIWCLTTYYLFILVHRVLKMRGAAVYRPRE